MGNTNTVGTMGGILFIAIIFITAFNFMGEEVYDRNPNLDTKSLEIINTLDYGATNTYNNNSLIASQSALSQNSSFVNVDPYSRQYLEDKGESTENEGIISKLVNLPIFLYRLIGIEIPTFILTLIGIVGVYIGYLIGLAIYKFLKGETD